MLRLLFTGWCRLVVSFYVGKGGEDINILYHIFITLHLGERYFAFVKYKFVYYVMYGMCLNSRARMPEIWRQYCDDVRGLFPIFTQSRATHRIWSPNLRPFPLQLHC